MALRKGHFSIGKKKRKAASIKHKRVYVGLKVYFGILLEANMLTERRRWEYNTVRPHSALGYKPPEAIEVPDSETVTLGVVQ